MTPPDGADIPLFAALRADLADLKLQLASGFAECLDRLDGIVAEQQRIITRLEALLARGRE